MKVIVFYSDLDDFIVTCIVAITAIVFLFSWAKNKLKFQKGNSNYLFENEEIETDLSHYSLNFESITVESRTIGFRSKVVLFMLALVIVIMPLYEFVETLRPASFYFGYSCFPNGL
ncbi:hypothetical protein [Winogradskyella sp.]|uniref:hypothetical protein n=1 Tax=Winogradskyella sp. TaxID=1883156 RepID=UPI0025E9110A|nr:hypothetical protein [Winogradskyella sp.]